MSADYRSTDTIYYSIGTSFYTIDLFNVCKEPYVYSFDQYYNKLKYIYISTLSTYNENKINPCIRCSSFVLEKYHSSMYNDRKIKNINI